jgi:murein L,D-transpeptidase YcbB/YkuD
MAPSAMSRLTITLLLSSLLVVAAPAVYAQSRRQSTGAKATNEPGASAKEALGSILRAGKLEDLQWPDFSDHRNDVASLYKLSNYTLVWLRNGRPIPQTLQLIGILQDADSEGLRPEDYDGSRWAARLSRMQSQHSADEEVHFDVALTVCAMRYSSDLRIGRTNPQEFKFAIDEGPKENNDLPSFVMQRLANGNNLRAEMAALEPPLAGYRELKGALRVYEQLAQRDDGQKLPSAEAPGYPGPPYPGYERLCRFLHLLGDLPDSYSVEAGRKLILDPVLQQAVQNFQERHGLPMSGYLDAKTIEELNVPLSSRAEQIRLAMERYRWLRHYHRQDSVLINIPGFYLYAFDDQGNRALDMKVHVGDEYEDTRTPVMDAKIESLVFRPYWEVPLDIQRDEIFRRVSEVSNLSELDYEAISSSGHVVGGKVTNTLLKQIRAGRIQIRQRPGPENPMGLLKFVLPNRYSVYLHDRPYRDLEFMSRQGAASHGCIHIEKPAELAAWVLRDQAQWDLNRVQQAMLHGPDNVRVSLSKPVPILIFYTTASTLQHDHLHFYHDIYGYDAELSDALAKAYPQRKK